MERKISYIIMNCNDINNFLPAFLDNALPEQELKEVTKHLEVCLTCIEKVLAEKELEKAFKEKLIKSVPTPEGFNNKILQKIAEIPVLKITYQDGHKEIRQIGEDIITIGRSSKNIIVLPSDKEVSRKHCQIEQKEGKYEITDLNSRNGVYINDKKLPRHILSPGDRIRIGHANIIFDLSGVTTAIQTEKKTKSATIITEVVSPTPSLTKRRKQFLRKKVSQSNTFSNLVKAALILIILGIVISIVSQNINNIKPRLTPKIPGTQPTGKHVGNLEKELDETYSSINSLAREYRYKEAIAKGKELINQYSEELNDSQKHYLETRIELLEQYLLKEAEAKDKLAKLEKESKDTTDINLLKNKYEELYLNSLNTSLASKIKEKIDNFGELAEQQNSFQQALAKIQPQATENTDKGDYAQAIRQYSSLNTDNPANQFLLTKEIDLINKKAKVDFDSLIRQCHELVDRKEFEKTKDLYLTNKSRFQETNYSEQLDSELFLINKLISQEEEKKGLSRKLSLKSLHESEQLSKQYDYTEAILKLNEALKSAESDYPELKHQFSSRLNDLNKEESLFHDFLPKIKGKTISISRIGLQGTVLTPTNESFYVNKRINKWAFLNPDEMYVLYKTAGLIYSQPDNAAVFCLEHKLMDGIYETFNLILQKNPNRKSELDNLFAQASGKKVPAGGFVVYKNKWLSPEEKAGLVATETALNLAQKFKSTLPVQGTQTGDKQQEIEKICRDFNQLFKANPTQQTELHKIITEAIKEKYNGLKKVLDKKLATVNLEQLATLKKELNKKRQAALKEIREGKPVGVQGGKPKLSEEMDRKIKEVRTLWEKPLEGIIQLDKSVKETVDRMIFFTGELKKYNTIAERTAYDLDIISSLAMEGKIDIKNFALNGGEAGAIKFNKKIMEENEANKTASAGEKEMVRIQNEYRIMMGLTAVRINDALTKASHKHSAFMESSKQFAHSGIGDGDPSSRARAEGYSGPAGENIAMGMQTPYDAFNGWYWSHGHHLNMIGLWNTIGGGISGVYYTTMFGR